MKAKHKKQLTLFAVVVLVFCAGGGVLIVLGTQKYAASRAFVIGTESADGRVIGFEKWDAPGVSLREDLHYAVVLYKLKDGSEVRFRGPSKDGLVKLRQRDDVRVLYHPANPQEAKVDSFMSLWFAATMLWGLGAAAILIPLLTLWQAYKWVKRQDDTT